MTATAHDVQGSTLEPTLAPTFAAAHIAGDKFLNSGREVVHVRNDDASPTTMSLANAQQCDQSVTHSDVSVVVPAGEERRIGPFSTSRFNDDSGFITVSFSNETDVTMAVFKTGS